MKIYLFCFLATFVNFSIKYNKNSKVIKVPKTCDNNQGWYFITPRTLVTNIIEMVEKKVLKFIKMWIFLKLAFFILKVSNTMENTKRIQNIETS